MVADEGNSDFFIFICFQKKTYVAEQGNSMAEKGNSWPRRAIAGRGGH